MYIGTDVTDMFRIRTLYTAFTEEIGSDYFYTGERHNFWELLIAMTGEVGVTAGENAWVLHQGQAVLHPPMEFHRVWYSGTPGKILVFSFGAEGLPLEAGGGFAVKNPAAAEYLLEQIQSHFSINGIHITSADLQETEAQIIIKRLELFLLELASQKKLIRQEARSSTAKNYAAIVRILENNIHQNLNIAQIAELCNMSQINVKKTFSLYTGMGIINYYNRLKIDAAISMLRSGSSVQETADTLGFSSHNYFSVVFKRITGKSPTKYK